MVYDMERGCCSWVLPVFLILICTISAGCLTGVPEPVPQATLTTTVATPTPESPVVTRPVADMALELNDLPQDYTLRDRSVTAYAGVDQIFRDLGWQQGYQVSFYRLDKDRDSTTSIIQEIDIYPPDTVNDAYSLEKERLLPRNDHATDYQVPFPQQGDRSIAWRQVRTTTTVPIVTYTVIFTKKNVYEKISMTGTSTDYEALKTIAQTAAAKIQ